MCQAECGTSAKTNYVINNSSMYKANEYKPSMNLSSNYQRYK